MRSKALCVTVVFLANSFASSQALPPATINGDQTVLSQAPASAAPPPTASATLANVQEIEANCRFNPAETDPKKIRKANTCIANAIRLRQERMRQEQRLFATEQAEARLAATSTEPGGANGTGVTPGTTPMQNFDGGSLSGTPSTCIVSNAISNPALIRVHREILTAQTSSDNYGYRLGKRYIVYQVTVENGSKDYQFMLQDISVDFSHQMGLASGSFMYNASGQDLSVLRGVPEKGEDMDPRNKILHVLQGVGAVAGAVSGLSSFADVMGPSVAIFNGTFLQSYSNIAPDHTSTQLNRLSDNAFTGNTIIDKQRSKTISMFIPADEVMSVAEQKRFRTDPYEFLGFDGQDGRLNQADICVDGAFIESVTSNPPVLTAVAFAPGSSRAPGTDAIFYVSGGNLVAGDTMLILSGAVPVAAPVTVGTDGRAGTALVRLPVDFNPATTTFHLESKTKQSLSSGPGIKL